MGAKKTRVVVAMSGGVDSAVAAVLLQMKHFEVIGVTMCFNLADIETKKPRCCGISGIRDAQRIAHKLGIRHYILNMRQALEDHVINDFCREYSRGRTPNPCVRCNQFVKFDVLLKKAISLEADYLATGHYARITTTPNSARRTPNYFLRKAADKHKDQSYFLYRLGQKQLRRILFPVGGLSKPAVRQIARENGLAVAQKKESQEICFLPQDDYRSFLAARLKKGVRPGAVVDLEGNLLGEHKGIAFYTVGQRQGIGIATGYPAYVVRIDAPNNRLVLGRRQDVSGKGLWLKDLHFVNGPLEKKIALKIKIRYNHRDARAKVTPLGKRLKVIFKEPQFAVTPGQSAVLYSNDIVIGGGIIEKVINEDD
jgi:tRNA-specific 2-thiouridylase